jgi:hypothetical protein
MKTLVTTLALLGMLAAPAFAQKFPAASSNALYGCGGQYLGTDPDPNIRSELSRDCGVQYGQ